MKKFIFLTIMALVFPCLPLMAAETISVTNTGAPEIKIYPSEFDKLVMDFTVKKIDGSADVLKALTFSNDGTARNFIDISKVVVWADAGPAGFQGMEIDKKLGEAIRYETANYWYLSGLNESVPASGLRIFISIESAGKGSIVGNKTVQMRVHPLSDTGTAGQFDLGDTGLFLSGGQGLATSILNSSVQTISFSNYDQSGPKVVITDPASGATLGSTAYKIKGVARDQGGSTPANLYISINSGSSAGSWATVVNTGENYSTWEYDWTGIIDGTYTIKTQSSDWIGNVTTSDGITVTVDQTAASASSADLSTVSVSPGPFLADGVDKATITVTVKNSAGVVLGNRNVSLASDRTEDKIEIYKNPTDENGMAVFKVSSIAAGTSIFTITAGDVVLSQKPTVIFDVAPFHAGELIRGTGTAVYYFGSDGKKYLFPTSSIYSSWYLNFTDVKNVAESDVALRGLGGNVTVRPARLVQFVSMDTPWQVMDPKVYAVETGGILRWLKTAEVAEALFGASWEATIIPVPEVFATNYMFGSDIEMMSDYNLDMQRMVESIGQDKNLE